LFFGHWSLSLFGIQYPRDFPKLALSWQLLFGSRYFHFFALELSSFFYVGAWLLKNSFPDIISGFREKQQNVPEESQERHALRPEKGKSPKNEYDKNRDDEKQLAVKKAVGGNENGNHRSHPKKLFRGEAKGNFVFDVYVLRNVCVHRCDANLLINACPKCFDYYLSNYKITS